MSVKSSRYAFIVLSLIVVVEVELKFRVSLLFVKLVTGILILNSLRVNVEPVGPVLPVGPILPVAPD